ncbi:MAG: glycosyltransferase family 4 protein [Gammaproteobacteria bacterium]|nr:glycosyltransferase family 4 protein [Gammaproteobacteria bacterium]
MKKNILYCESNTDGTIGGSFFSLLFLVQNIDKSKYNPVVVFYSENSLIPKYRESGIETIVITLPKPVHFRKISSSNPVFKLLNLFISIVQSGVNFFKFFIFQSFRYAYFLKKRNISLVHLNNSIIRNHDWMMASWITGIKCITHERGINTRYSKLSRFFAKKLKAVVSISNAVRENMLDKGLNTLNYVTIYNGLDPDQIHTEGRSVELANEFGLKKSNQVIGVVGNIKEWKGQESVIRATKIIKEKYPDIKCLIVGDISKNDEYYANKLYRLVEEFDLSENVIFTGYQNNVANFLELMDVVIHSSIHPEPFGRVILEAMAMRKPIVGTRYGAIPEIIVEGQTGFMFTPDDENDLANGVLKCLNDPELAEKLGQQGYDRLVSNFHIKFNVSKTEQLYKELIG